MRFSPLLCLSLAALPGLAQGTPVAPASTAPSLVSPSGRPLLRKAVLQVVAAPVFRSMSLDLKALDKEARALLGRNGVEVVPEKGADPAATWHIGVEVNAISRAKGIYFYSSTQRCSLLADKALASNERGKPQRIWFAERVCAQKGAEGLGDRVLKAVRETLGDILPPAPPFAGARGDREHPVVQAFDAARVAYMAPRPLYPDDVEVQKVHSKVALDVLVNPQGAPMEVEALTGDPLLIDVSVVNAFLWQWKPLAGADGAPQWSRVRLEITYWTGRPLSQHFANPHHAIDPQDLQRPDAGLFGNTGKPVRR